MNREALEALRERVGAGNITLPSGLIFDAFGGRSEFVGLARGAYHGSLDAAKALHEAVLPGWTCGLQQLLVDGEDEVSDDWVCTLHKASNCRKSFSSESANPARSWLLAILSALIAQTEEGE